MAGKLEGSNNLINEEVEALKESIHKAKETAFRKVDQKINKPYISDKTMQLREERQKTRDNQDGPKEKAQHKQVRNAVKADKRKYWAELLDKEDWKEVKLTKKGFMPKYTRLKHENGVIATSEERPEILADSFQKGAMGQCQYARNQQIARRSQRI